MACSIYLKHVEILIPKVTTFRIVGWALELEALIETKLPWWTKAQGSSSECHMKTRIDSNVHVKTSTREISPEIHQPQKHGKDIPAGATQPTAYCR